jgi:hypothetical protein
MGIADWMATVPGLEDIEELAFPEDFDGTEAVRSTPDGGSPQPEEPEGPDDPHAEAPASAAPDAGGAKGAAPADGRHWLKGLFSRAPGPKAEPRHKTKPVWFERTKGEDGTWSSVPHYGAVLPRKASAIAKEHAQITKPRRMPIAKRNRGKRPLGRMASR